MKHFTLSVIAVLMLSVCNCSLYAQQRSKEKSLSIANKQLLHKNAILVHEHKNMSVYNNRDKKGFVIVSDNEQLPEVLGFSDNGYFDPENIPANMKFWMESMQMACDAVLSGKAKIEDVFATSTAETKEIQPLLGDIEWSQEAPYNYDCPVVDGVNCPTGCAATALAMILKYYEYPKIGIGSKSYTTSTKKLNLSYNFEDHPFDWANMQNKYSTLTITDKKETVSNELGSKLIFAGFMPRQTLGGIFISVDSLTCSLPSGSSFAGDIQFLLYDTKGNFLESVGEPAHFDKFEGQTWWPNPGYSVMATMPATYPDGDYHLYIAYKEDGSSEWKKLQQFKQEGKGQSFVETQPAIMKKEGRNVYYGGLKGACQYTLEETKAVSDLMFACGVAMNMDYRATESGAEVIHGTFPCIRNNFGYDRDMFLVYQANAAKQAELVIEQLEKKAPVFIGGATEKGYGHAFIADGLRYTQKGAPVFHINWGWSGMSNGYFLLTNLNPDATGTGADDGDNFSYLIHLLCGLKPEDGHDEAPSITFGSMSLSKTSINTGSKVAIKVLSLINVSTFDIDGTVNAFLVGEDGQEYNLGEFFATNSTWNSLDGYSMKSKSMLIPESVPAGTYKVELRAALSNDPKSFGRCVGVPETLIVNNATGIIDIVNDGDDSSNEKAYDLYGRSVKQMSEGNYYIKGNKVIKK